MKNYLKIVFGYYRSVSYVINMQAINTKDFDVFLVKPSKELLVSCTFLKYVDSNIQIRYIVTRPLYAFLGYATSLLHSIVKGITTNVRITQVIIAYYPSIVIGMVSQTQISKLKYPGRRYVKYGDQCRDSIFGFRTALKLQLGTYTGPDRAHYVKFYTNYFIHDQ